MYDNFTEMVKKSSAPTRDGLHMLEALCNYDDPNEHDSRSSMCKFIINHSLAPTSYSYQSVYKIFLEYYLVFLSMAYPFLYEELWKQRVTTTRLKFKEL